MKSVWETLECIRNSQAFSSKYNQQIQNKRQRRSSLKEDIPYVTKLIPMSACLVSIIVHKLKPTTNTLATQENEHCESSSRGNLLENLSIYCNLSTALARGEVRTQENAVLSGKNTPLKFDHNQMQQYPVRPCVGFKCRLKGRILW